ncbi:hypothetical protein KEM55_004888 [Ascosphaera atra]|nr:hypothetical protein KEM55_004888 [Ascosphaera atra]
MALGPRKTAAAAKPAQKKEGIAGSLGGNPAMVEFPRRMGKPEEFASFTLELIRNPMLNGNVFRIDGAVRMPSKL